jgi:DHA2 family multidrug resistance protein
MDVHSRRPHRHTKLVLSAATARTINLSTLAEWLWFWRAAWPPPGDILMLDQFVGHDRLRSLTLTEQDGARGSAPAANVVPHNLAASIPTGRTAAVLAASEALAAPSGAPGCVRSLWRSIWHDEEKLAAQFEDADELVVAIAEHKALVMTQALYTGGYPRSEDVARDTLVAFGLASWNEYSTSLPGLVRLLVAEGQRNPGLKQRVYDAGPAFVTSRLCEFRKPVKPASSVRRMPRRMPRS